MSRTIWEIESDERAELDKMKSLNSEIEKIETKQDNGDTSPGLDERIGNLKRGVNAALERTAELILELKEAVMEGIKAGRFGFETGSDGGGSGGAFGGTVVDTARRRVDALCKSAALPDHAAEIAETLLTKSTGNDQSLAARWALAAGDSDYLSAFVKLMADPTRGHLLWTGPEQAAYQKVAHVAAELKASALSPDSAGGFMVPFTLDPAILLTSAGSVNPLRKISRVVQIVTDTWNEVSSAGVTRNGSLRPRKPPTRHPRWRNPRFPCSRVPLGFPTVTRWAWTR